MASVIIVPPVDPIMEEIMVLIIEREHNDYVLRRAARMAPEWIESPDGLRRVLRLDFTELGGDFEWLDSNGARTYTMMHAVLYRRIRDNKLFRMAKDREPEDCGRVQFLEEI